MQGLVVLRMMSGLGSFIFFYPLQELPVLRPASGEILGHCGIKIKMRGERVRTVLLRITCGMWCR